MFLKVDETVKTVGKIQVSPSKQVKSNQLKPKGIVAPPEMSSLFKPSSKRVAIDLDEMNNPHLESPLQEEDDGEATGTRDDDFFN